MSIHSAPAIGEFFGAKSTRRAHTSGGWAGRDDVRNSLRDDCGRLRLMPTDVQHFPALGCELDVALLVEPLGLRSEVVATAVRLDGEFGRGDCEIDTGDHIAVPITNSVLRDHRWNSRIVEAASHDLFEPTLRHVAFERDCVEQPAQHSGSGLPRSVESRIDLVQVSHRHSPTSSIGKGPVDELPIPHD